MEKMENVGKKDFENIDQISDQKEIRYWHCTIGVCEEKDLRPGADYPLRIAVIEAYKNTVDKFHDVCLSGWKKKNEMDDVKNVVSLMDVEDPLYHEIKNLLKINNRIT